MMNGSASPEAAPPTRMAPVAAAPTTSESPVPYPSSSPAPVVMPQPAAMAAPTSGATTTMSVAELYSMCNQELAMFGAKFGATTPMQSTAIPPLPSLLGTVQQTYFDALTQQRTATLSGVAEAGTNVLALYDASRTVVTRKALQDVLEATKSVRERERLAKARLSILQDAATTVESPLFQAALQTIRPAAPVVASPVSAQPDATDPTREIGCQTDPPEMKTSADGDAGEEEEEILLVSEPSSFFYRRTVFTLRELVLFAVNDEDTSQSHDTRRSLLSFKYDPTHCGDMKKDGVCPTGDACPHCHNEVEFSYHPFVYKREPCTNTAHMELYGKEMGRDVASMLQQCPCYHTKAEHAVFAAWRTSFMGYHPALHGVKFFSQSSRFGAKLRKHPLFARLAAVVEEVPSSPVVVRHTPFNVCVAAGLDDAHTAVMVCTMGNCIGLNVLYPSDKTSPLLGLEPTSSSVHAMSVLPRFVDPLLVDVAHPPLYHHEIVELAAWLLTLARPPFSVTLPMPPAANAMKMQKPQALLSYLRVAADTLLLVPTAPGYPTVENAPLVCPPRFLRQLPGPVLLLVVHWTLCSGWIARSIVQKRIVAWLQGEAPDHAPP